MSAGGFGLAAWGCLLRGPAACEPANGRSAQNVSRPAEVSRRPGGRAAFLLAPSQHTRTSEDGAPKGKPDEVKLQFATEKYAVLESAGPRLQPRPAQADGRYGLIVDAFATVSVKETLLLCERLPRKAAA